VEGGGSPKYLGYGLRQFTQQAAPISIVCFEGWRPPPSPPQLGTLPAQALSPGQDDPGNSRFWTVHSLNSWAHGGSPKSVALCLCISPIRKGRRASACYRLWVPFISCCENFRPTVSLTLFIFKDLNLGQALLQSMAASLKAFLAGDRNMLQSQRSSLHSK